MTADDLTAIEGLSLADTIHVSTQTLAERYARFGEVPAYLRMHSP